jgi:NADPH-dependent curcumin reductase CurA
MISSARAVLLKQRPARFPASQDFELVEQRLPVLGPGQVLVRNLWMSVDPYMRARMYDGPGYVDPFKLGEPMLGGAIGAVVESQAVAFSPGDLVASMFGWREAFVSDEQSLTRLPQGAVPIEAHLGVLGMPGFTAYGGMKRIGEPKAGETVFVSGAAGAVGSIACQIAKIEGCRVIGAAGSDEKCDWLRSIGIDAAINYRTCGDLTQALRAAAPSGIDVYFDNVGGEFLQAALEVANPFARFVECGMIAGVTAAVPLSAPTNLLNVVRRRIKMQGYISFDFADLQGRFEADMARWIAEGRIQWQQTVEYGIENATAAFLQLFAGANLGKMLVKLA